MAKEKLEGVESTTPEKSDILPESQLKFNEDGSVTIPETTLSNPSEALKYIRSLENSTISKLRESNEYVINEIREMLEDSFKSYYRGFYEKETLKNRCMKNNKEVPELDPKKLDKEKYYYVEGPLEFLLGYEGNLSNFMDILAQEIKKPQYYICERFGISEKELLSMDTVSIIENFKKDIKNLTLIEPFEMSNQRYRHQLGQWYCIAIMNACRKLGYKG